VPRVSRRLRVIFTTTAGAALVAGVLASAASPASAQSTSARVPLSGSQPAWAVSSARVSQQATGTVTANVYLAGQNQAGLAAFATAVATPGNALYGHYLTAAQLKSEYGPTAGQVSAVSSWLTSAGLKVTKVEDGIGGYVQVQGSVKQAARAFDVSFSDFRGPDKQIDRAPDSAATIPAGVASDVLDVSGLDTASHYMKPADTLPPPGPNYWIAQPCSQYYGQKIATNEPSAYGKKQPWTNCGYTPQQIRGAYNVTGSGMTGAGQTVAVVDAYVSPTLGSDANQFSTYVGDQPFRPGQFTEDLSSTWNSTAADECDAAGWYGEQTLDVESVHDMAQNANVVYVGAASCNDDDLLAALALIVDNHVASIVTDSWGEPWDDATLTTSYDQVFEAGAAEGIGFFFSSGDSGYESPAEDSGSDTIQVDWPDSSPYVTAVGGTSLAIGKNDNYEFETAWGTLLDPLTSSGTAWQYTPPGLYPDYYDGSSGGGVSNQFTQPSYQAGVVPYSLATSLPGGATATQPMRVVPDVAALADPSTGMLVGETTLQPNGTSYAFSLSRIGGTSVASPTFAGIEADAQQAAGHVLGFANPAIYQRYNTSAFHDVTDNPLGSGYLAEIRNNYTDPYTKQGPIVTWLRTLGIDGEGAAALPATKGYDDATGVGSPDYYIQSFLHGYQ
jgi:subtilase family serine protease